MAKEICNESYIFEENKLYSEEEVVSHINNMTNKGFRKNEGNEIVEYIVDNIEYIQGEYYRGISYQFKKNQNKYLFIKYQELENIIFNPLNPDIRVTLMTFILALFLIFIIYNIYLS